MHFWLVFCNVIITCALLQGGDVVWDQRVDIAVSRAELSVGTFGVPVLAEMAMKIALNAVTTCGHVLKGKVMRNKMVDLQVSNNKLFFRSISIVADFANATPAHARDSLLRSIYTADHVTPEVTRHFKRVQWLMRCRWTQRRYRHISQLQQQLFCAACVWCRRPLCLPQRL